MNGVLNQIPAGDGRESSREQAVLDDGAPFLMDVSYRGPGDPFPPLELPCGFGGRAASLTHKKKKKKRGEKQRQGWCGSGNHTWAVRWRLCKHSGAGVEARRE